MKRAIVSGDGGLFFFDYFSRAMPTDVGDMITRVESVLAEINSIYGDAIQESAESAIHWNQEQLLEGYKANGEMLDEYKWASYALYKHLINPRPMYGIADAKRTGGLYRDMYVRVSVDTVTFGSTATTAAFMIERDGEEIFGLSDESIELYKEAYMPIAQRIVRERTVGFY